MKIQLTWEQHVNITKANQIPLSMFLYFSLALSRGTCFPVTKGKARVKNTIFCSHPLFTQTFVLDITPCPGNSSRIPALECRLRLNYCFVSSFESDNHQFVQVSETTIVHLSVSSDSITKFSTQLTQLLPALRSPNSLRWIHKRATYRRGQNAMEHFTMSRFLWKVRSVIRASLYTDLHYIPSTMPRRSQEMRFNHVGISAIQMICIVFFTSKVGNIGITRA